MSFNLSTTGVNALEQAQPDMCGSYGIPNQMTHGPTSFNTGFTHPLEASKSSFHQSKLQREMKVMRNVQGLHAPMRLAMELKAASHVGRHPFLPSSFLMRDVILAQDEEIGFEDILNTPEFSEEMGQPHAIVEKKLRLL